MCENKCICVVQRGVILSYKIEVFWRAQSLQIGERERERETRVPSYAGSKIYLNISLDLNPLNVSSYGINNDLWYICYTNIHIIVSMYIPVFFTVYYSYQHMHKTYILKYYMSNSTWFSDATISSGSFNIVLAKGKND